MASWSSGDRIKVGQKWGAYPPMVSAGFLIHEMAHRYGMVDVCDVCHAAHLKVAHFQEDYLESTDLNCKSNDAHGALASSDGGHYVGKLARVKSLAERNKNLAVWNADSYRWFAYYFRQSDIDRAASSKQPW